MGKNDSVDFSKLKAEIHERKTKKGIVSNNLGEGTTIKHMAKDEFLNGLLTSIQTGQVNEATEKIRNINRTSDNLVVDSGAVVNSKPTSNNLKTETVQPTNTQVRNNNHTQYASDQDREQILFEEIERRKMEMLNGGAGTAKYNSGGQQPRQQQNLGVINEEVLNEKVDSLIKDKFAFIVEQAMKDSIVEIYAATRMKEAIEENTKVIRKIVIDTIRELQDKQKSKKPQ